MDPYCQYQPELYLGSDLKGIQWCHTSLLQSRLRHLSSAVITLSPPRYTEPAASYEHKMFLFFLSIKASEALHQTHNQKRLSSCSTKEFRCYMHDSFDSDSRPPQKHHPRCCRCVIYQLKVFGLTGLSGRPRPLPSGGLCRSVYWELLESCVWFTCCVYVMVVCVGSAAPLMYGMVGMVTTPLFFSSGFFVCILLFFLFSSSHCFCPFFMLAEARVECVLPRPVPVWSYGAGPFPVQFCDAQRRSWSMCAWVSCIL